MYSELNGRIAVVTGAGSGIGREICERFAREHMTIVATGRRSNVEQTMELVRQIDPGNKGMPIIMDVTDPDSVQSAVKLIVKEYGRVDVLVNNAGIPHEFMRAIDIPNDVAKHLMDVNFMGTFYCSKYFGQQMREQKFGNIINIGSWSGKTGSKFFGLYCASKAAMHVFAQSMALEMADFGVRVNTVCGGAIDGNRLKTSFESECVANGITFEEHAQNIINMIPLHRFGTGEDMANMATFLISDNASYITGQAINICGGIEFH